MNDPKTRLELCEAVSALERRVAELEAELGRERARSGDAEAERAQLAEIFSRVPAILCSTRGPRHVFTLSNSFHRALVGGRDVVGHEVREVLPEIAERGFADMCDHVYATGEPVVGREVPVRVIEMDAGGLRPGFFNFLFQPLRDRAGVVEGIFVFAYEVTVQVVARDRAEALSVDRKGLLERAEQERERAEEANRAKDEFLATLSHELRTPLNAVLGWTSMLRSGRLADDKRAQALEVIERNAQSQARLIEDLLDLSSLVLGKVRLSLAPIDPLEFIRRALESAQPAAEARGIALSASLEPGGGLVQGDESRLQQVVWNLLQNALKFTPRGGQIRVRLSRSDAQVEIAVTDTGKGIRAEFLPHVFDRFRQQDSSSTRVHGGLGLGLAIARDIVQLHGGSIQASSEGEGRGAELLVQLPLSAPRPSPLAEATPPTPETTGGPRGR